MGYKPPTICRMLREEGLIANRMGIHKFLQKRKKMNNIKRRPGSCQPTKMTAAVKASQRRSSSNRARIVLHRFIKRQIVLWSFYSAMNRFRTVRSFCLNRWGVLYKGKGRSIFVSFRKNGTITLYCHIL